MVELKGINATIEPNSITTASDTESDEDLVEVTVTKEKEYTEHTAEAEFIDGETREVTFDSMKQKDGAIVLKDYTGYSGSATLETSFLTTNASHSGFKSEAFMTIPWTNLRTFETTDRETKTLEYEVEKRVPEDEIQD